MKKISSLICAIICLFGATACMNTGTSETITDQAFTQCFAHVVDMRNNVDGNFTDIGYSLRLNYTNLTADVVISGLKDTDGKAYPTISLKGIKWSIEKDSKIVVKGNDLEPEMSGFAAMPFFNSFRLELVNRTLDGYYYPGLSVNYTIDGRFSVVSSYITQRMLATTTSTGDSGAAFSTTDTEYGLEFNMITNRLKITMYKSQFIAHMPAVDFVLDNIPFTFDGNIVKWDVDEIIPLYDGAPNRAFPITGLRGSFDFCGDFILDFTCNPVTAPGSYKVDALGSFTFVK